MFKSGSAHIPENKMKTLLLATLAATMLTAQAAENYGSVRFHSSVPADQIQSMKIDIKYLYTNPIMSTDADFLKASGLTTATGPTLHNWLVNRVKHVVGESFAANESNILINDKYVFPKTPVPDIGLQKFLTGEEGDTPAGDATSDDGVKTVMTNLGSALYLTGKIGMEQEQPSIFLLAPAKKVKIQFAMGVNLDGMPVYATSTRVGLLKVGEGLFFEKFRINAKDPNAVANSVNRLATMFHEARHSDGTGLSTGFTHAICPDYHAYGGYAACEKSSNGPYSIGAMAERLLLKNCKACAPEELMAIASGVLDSFSRVLSGKNAAIRLAQYQKVIAQYKTLLTNDRNLIATAPADQKEKIQQEIDKIEKVLGLLNTDVENLKKDLALVPGPMDAKPEGYYQDVSLQNSMASMAGQ